MENPATGIRIQRDDWQPAHLSLICGIANAGGGTLAIQFMNRNTSTGLRKMRRTFEQIPLTIERELGISCTTEPVLNGSVLCLEVIVDGAFEPVSYEGSYWYFEGSKAVTLSRRKIEEVFASRQIGDQTHGQLDGQAGARPDGHAGNLHGTRPGDHPGGQSSSHPGGQPNDQTVASSASSATDGNTAGDALAASSPNAPLASDASAGHNLAWERQPQPLARREDLSAIAFFAIASLGANEAESASCSLEEILQKRLDYLNLTEPDTHHLTNAGVLLLHTQPERFIPGATVVLALFGSEQTQPMRTDEVRGTLVHQLEESLRLLYEEYRPEDAPQPQSTSPLPASEGTAGSAATSAAPVPTSAPAASTPAPAATPASPASPAERPANACSLPPQEAVREALLNALAHKDYPSGTPIRIGIYPDRISIENPSEPAQPGSNIADRKHPKLRNPLLANALRLLGLTSGWGNGLPRLASMCEAAGKAAPTICHDHDHVAVVFPLGFVETTASAAVTAATATAHSSAPNDRSAATDSPKTVAARAGRRENPSPCEISSDDSKDAAESQQNDDASGASKTRPKPQSSTQRAIGLSMLGG